MLRSECLKSVVEFFTDVPCFVTVGRAWTEWEELRPSDGNFQVKTLGSGSSHGLGLAMAHDIVRKASGAIRIESEPGHGTIFELLFPAVDGFAE